MNRNFREMRGFMMPSSYPQDHQAPLSESFKAYLAEEDVKLTKFFALTGEGVDIPTALRAAFPLREQARESTSVKALTTLELNDLGHLLSLLRNKP